MLLLAQQKLIEPQYAKGVLSADVNSKNSDQPVY